MKTIFLLLSIFAVCQCCTYYGYGVPDGDKAVIVNKHNELRTLIAQGKVSGQPRGVNLKRLQWDTNLANAAQNIANSCKFAHQAVHDDRWAVGQNLFMSYESNYNLSSNWNSAIQGWFDEHKVYKYPGGFSDATGHYTQVVWANTQFVGCGWTYFQEGDTWYKKMYVCNYGPAEILMVKHHTEPERVGARIYVEIPYPALIICIAVIIKIL